MQVIYYTCVKTLPYIRVNMPSRCTLLVRIPLAIAEPGSMAVRPSQPRYHTHRRAQGPANLYAPSDNDSALCKRSCDSAHVCARRCFWRTRALTGRSWGPTCMIRTTLRGSATRTRTHAADRNAPRNPSCSSTATGSKPVRHNLCSWSFAKVQEPVV